MDDFQVDVIPEPAGATLALLGVAMLVTGAEIGLGGREDLLGGLLVLGGAFCWAAGSMIGRYEYHKFFKYFFFR